MSQPEINLTPELHTKLKALSVQAHVMPANKDLATDLFELIERGYAEYAETTNRVTITPEGQTALDLVAQREAQMLNSAMRPPSMDGVSYAKLRTTTLNTQGGALQTLLLTLINRCESNEKEILQLKADIAALTPEEPEEVESADRLQFPSIAQEKQRAGLGLSDWLAIAGFVFGLGGLVFGFMAFRKPSK